MQEIIVALIVACAAFVVARRYLPASARNALRTWSAKAANKLGWPSMANKLTAAAAQDCGSGCGSCKSCGPAPAVTDNARQIPIKPI